MKLWLSCVALQAFSAESDSGRHCKTILFVTHQSCSSQLALSKYGHPAGQFIRLSQR